MGRGKLSMELIKNWKARNLAFQIRKNTLKKKVYELATLCGIKAMVIIYGPKQDTLQTCPPPEPEVLPDNRDQVLDLINNYKGQSPEDRRKKTVLLSDFYKGKIEKAEKDLTDLRYPTWDPRFNSFTENDLCRFVADLENSIIKNAKAKLEQMKANDDSNNVDCAYLQLQQQRMLTKKRSMDFEAENQTNKYRVTMDPHQEGLMRVPVPMPMPNQQERPMSSQQERFPFVDHYREMPMPNQQERPMPYQQERFPFVDREMPMPNQQERPMPNQQERFPFVDHHREMPMPNQQERPMPNQQERPMPNQQERFPFVDHYQEMPMPNQQVRPIPNQQERPMPNQQERFPFVDHYQDDQRMVNFGYNNFGGVSNIMYNAHPSQALYDSPTMAGTVDSILYANSLVQESPNYDGDGRQATAQHLMEYYSMRPAGSAPHQMGGASTSHQPDAQFYEDHNW